MFSREEDVEPKEGLVPAIIDPSLATMESVSNDSSSAMVRTTTVPHAANVSLGDKTSKREIDRRNFRNDNIRVSATSVHGGVISSRPILVGYAFGPKKMSTMGIIMAEASKALSTVATDTTPPGAASMEKPVEALWLSSTASSSSSPRGLTKAALEKRVHHFDERTDNMIPSAREGEITEEDEEEVSSVVSIGCRSFVSNQTMTGSSFNGEDGGDIGLRLNFCGGGNAGMHNIIRFFRSSCSSSASLADSSITTATAGTVTVTQSHTSSARIDVVKKAGDGSNAACMRNIRVSFVPLDLDSPLEEQHGGKFDAILHKMTEDILCLSHNARRYDDTGSRLSTEEDEVSEGEHLPSSSPASHDDNTLIHATERVGRLVAYQRDHPECCLVDHPSNVQALMSRSDIARVLSDSLVGVTTRSGSSVRTPRFLVIDNRDDFPSPDDLAEQIEQAPFTYPLIAKPLTAAGTKESHRMAVILGRSGLQQIRPPCILQEYANHGGTLFKVYVLGDAVRVYARPSLPDLPPGDRCVAPGIEGRDVSSDFECYVEFDSQRPYPKLSDFGMLEEVNVETQNSASGRRRSDFSTRHDSENHDPSTTQSGKKSRKRPLSPLHRPPPKMSKKAAVAGHHLSADEIRPVVTVLKKAFGLELFGFDVLVKKKVSNSGDILGREMLVVDVNYFPSYKEVSNFPSLLAQYLTQRAIEGRMKKLHGNDI